MGHRVLVASGETGSTVSAGSVVAFPSADTNLWHDRVETNLHDVKVMASLSASANYLVRLVARYDDPSTGSTFDGVVEEFGPTDSVGDGPGREAFRSDVDASRVETNVDLDGRRVAEDIESFIGKESADAGRAGPLRCRFPTGRVQIP